MNLVPVSAAARCLNVTVKAVKDAAKAGRITLVEGQVDLDTVLAQWKANTNPNHVQIRGKGSLAAVHPGNGHAKGPTFVDLRNQQKQTEIELARLRLERERGEWMRREDHERMAKEAGAATRDRLEAVPDRVAQIVAVETDPTRCRDLIAEEIRIALEDVARWGADA